MNELPVLNINFSDIRDISTEIRSKFQDYYNAKKKEYYNNGGRGRFTLRSKEEIQRNTEEFLKWKKSQDVLKNAINSFDFNGITNNEYKESFRQLQKDYENEELAYSNYKNANKANGVNGTHKFYCPIAYWCKEMKATYNYELLKECIIYNEDHYALWGQNHIYILNDYRVYDKKGNITRHQTKKNAKKAMKRYCKLFYNMLSGSSFEYYLWSIIEFCRQTIELNNFFLSPMDIYLEAYKIYTTKSRKALKCAPKLNVRKHKILYLEPGYEKEAREAYSIYKKELEKGRIRKYLMNIPDGEIDLKMLALAIGQYKITKENWETIETEYGQYSEGGSKLEIVDERKLRKIVNELIKENPKLENKFIKHKQHKQQERSLWHKLVDEGKTYEEIHSLFDYVKPSAYRTYKTRKKK